MRASRQATLGWVFAIAGLIWVFAVVKTTAPSRVSHRAHHQRSHQKTHVSASLNTDERDDVDGGNDGEFSTKAAVKGERRNAEGEVVLSTEETAGSGSHSPTEGESPTTSESEPQQPTPAPTVSVSYDYNRHYVCSHRGLHDDRAVNLAESLQRLCPIDDVALPSSPPPLAAHNDTASQPPGSATYMPNHADFRRRGNVCCADYDVFFSSDGVPFIGHPDVVAKKVAGLSGADALLTHEDNNATSSASLLAGDPKGHHTVPLSLVAKYIEKLSDKMKQVGCTADDKECRHVYFSFEPKMPSEPKRQDGIMLQQLSTLTDAIGKEISGQEHLCGIIIDPREGTIAEDTREKLPSELKMIAPLKDKRLEENLPDKDTLYWCNMLIEAPSWAHLVAPSIKFLERCIASHLDELEHKIANTRRHFKKKHRGSAGDAAVASGEAFLPAMEVWLVDGKSDLKRLDAVAMDVKEFVPKYYVSNNPVKVKQLLWKGSFDHTKPSVLKRKQKKGVVNATTISTPHGSP